MVLFGSLLGQFMSSFALASDWDAAILTLDVGFICSLVVIDPAD
jgi:hypothetical protein